MANFAEIKDGAVTNVIVADTKEIAEQVTGLTCVEYTEDMNVKIGWEYDGSNFIDPHVVAQEKAAAEAAAKATEEQAAGTTPTA